MNTLKTKEPEFTVQSGQIPAGDVAVYEYGVRVDRETEAAVAEQIHKSRRLYNNVVAIMRSVVEEMQAFTIERAGPAAAAAKDRIDALTERFDAARAASDEPTMKQIAQERREQWEVLGDLLKTARKAHRQEIQERFLSRIGNKSTCATYQARCAAVAEGLGWGTANATLDAALQAFKKSFTLGRAPRFAKGEEIDQDTLTLQFTLKGGLPVDALLTGKQADLRLLPSNGCGRRSYGEFSFRLGAASANQYASGTWQYHRPVPEKSTIGLARLIRRRMGQKYRWAIQLLVKLPEPIRVATAERQPLATVHFGWAMDITGRRVAAIADAADPGCARMLALPAAIEAGLERAAAIQGERDAARDEIAVLARKIEIPETAEDALKELMERLRKTAPQHISANRLHYLCRLLSKADRMPDWLERWRQVDKRKWQDQTHLAKRARNARKTFYRQTAIDLARQYETIAIEPLDLKEAALKVNEVTGEKTEFTRKARAGRVVAALYEFETAIRWAAAKAGTALLELNGPTASVCAVCGGTMSAHASDHQRLICGSCGADLDRKLNGAAVAWQQVSEQREDAVETFWLEHHAEQAAKVEKREVTKAKKAQGRRDARVNATGGDEKEGSANP